ncbi:aminopeptidase N-like [Ptychodera flava]|uniref:aminopeptidase N-like n=1 Tax=Ptychodera flava TaxID=63121 RepID=UPI00396A5981
MATEEKYRIAPEKNGIFVKYVALVIAVILVLVVLALVIVMVYFLHPGWPCATTSTDPSDGLPAAFASVRKPFDGRLPDNLKPVNYRVKFTPYLDEEDGDKRFLVDGEVQITVNCVKSSNSITLHALKLDIDRDTVTVNEVSSGNSIDVRDISVDEEYDFFIINTAATLERGKEYHISMSYVALMNNTDLMALFLNVYEENGQPRYLLASQLAVTDGRRVFPCFDEPALKATFDVIIKHRTKRSALSNMPNIRNETDGDWNTAYFNTTPVMPVYLLAVLVSDFVCKEATTNLGVKFRVWASKTNINATDFALDVGVKSLQHFEDLLQIPYPLPKLDMVSLPVFMDYGAMENWGLIMYKHDWMLYDEAVHHPPRAQRVARIVAHELAHMWFGNLVTLRWWNVSWLNEGFGRHFEFIAVDEVLPEWDIYNQFYQDAVTFKSMDDDASSESHPTVQSKVGWREEIWTQYDTRIYERGAHIIQMVRSFLGHDAVFNGLRAYQNKYNYSNAVSDDVWAELEQSAKDAGKGQINVADIMNPWILQLGFPVVTVSRDGVNRASASQWLFKLDPDDDIPGGDDFSWHVPLTYMHSGNLNYGDPSMTWLNKSTDKVINLDDDGKNNWILANIRHNGYYRVKYDDENWNKLISQLKTDHKSIPVRTSAAMIDDAFNLARSGDVDAVLALSAIGYLRDEKEYSPWNAAIRNLRYIRDMLETSPSYGNLQSYIRELIEPLYEDLGWAFSNDDTHIQYYLRLDSIKLSCQLNKRDCVQKARDIYSRWMDDQETNSIRDDIRATVMCTAIKHGDYEEWKFAYEVFANTSDYTYALQSDIAYALACTPRLWILHMYLAESLQHYKNVSSVKNDDVIMPTELTSLGPVNDFYRMCGFVRDQSPLGFLTMWKFMRNHFDELRSIDEDKAYSFIWDFARKMNTAKQLMELEDFARKYSDMPDNQVTKFYKTLRQVNANIQWMTRNYAGLEEWFEQNTQQ